MIAYFDSSSIVKWFFDEVFSEAARDVKNQAEIVITSLVAYPEVLSAMNRAFREGRCAKSGMKTVRAEFLRIWPKFQWIIIHEEIVERAGELVFEHNLRGFDAIHLASALLVKQEDQKIDLFFSCFDATLNQAARTHGLLTHEFQLPSP